MTKHNQLVENDNLSRTALTLRSYREFIRDQLSDDNITSAHAYEIEKEIDVATNELIKVDNAIQAVKRL